MCTCLKLTPVTGSARRVLQDKDQITSAIQGSNDSHVGALLACEDEVRSAEKSRQQSHIQGVHQTEADRNRLRVQEIVHLREHFGQELDDLEEDCQNAGEQDDEY